MNLESATTLSKLSADAWGSGPGPVGMDWQETHYGITPIPNEHPPSLKNPRRVKTAGPETGWRKKDSKRKKKRARKELKHIMQWTLNQPGRPTVSQGAALSYQNPYPDTIL